MAAVHSLLEERCIWMSMLFTQITICQYDFIVIGLDKWYCVDCHNIIAHYTYIDNGAYAKPALIILLNWNLLIHQMCWRSVYVIFRLIHCILPKSLCSHELSIIFFCAYYSWAYGSSHIHALISNVEAKQILGN